MAEKLPILIRRWDGGLNKELASDELQLNMSPDMANANFDKGGSVKKEAGFKELGSDSEDVDIEDLWSIYDRQANEWLFKICGTKIKLYDATNSVFMTIKASLTASKKWGHIIYNNVLYAGNDTDNAISLDLSKITRLDGAILLGATDIDVVDASNLAASGDVYINNTKVSYTGKNDNKLVGCTNAIATADTYLVVQEPTVYVATTELNGALSGGEATIIVDSTTGFHSSGTLDINGTVVTYTSKSATQFNDCSNTPAAANNSVVSGYSGTPKGYIYEVFGGRLIIAGVSGSGKATLYGSKATDRTDFTIAGGGAANDAFAEVLPAGINAIRGFLDDNGAERIMAFCHNNQIYAIRVDDDATLGTLMFRNVFKQGVTALNHQSAIVGDNDIYHIDLDNQIRSLGARHADQGINKVFSDSISKNLKTYFKEDCSFDDARAVIHNDEYWLGLKEGSGDGNNAFFIYNKTTGAWRRRIGVSPKVVVVFQNKITFADSFNNKIFQRDEDLKNDDGNNIYFNYHTPDIDFSPLQFERVQKVKISGTISSNCVTKINIYRDFGSVKIGEFIISGNNSDIIGSILGKKGSFGLLAFGTTPFAGRTGDDKNFFMALLDLDSLPDLENFRLEFVNDQKNVYLEVSKVKPIILTMKENYFAQNYILTPNN